MFHISDFVLRVYSQVGKKRVIKKGNEQTEDGPEAKSSVSFSPKSAVGRRGRGIAYIQATYNNTIISITDEQGNTLGWSSAGAIGFSGTKKATPFAAARVAESVMDKVRRSGMQEIAVRVKGVGSGRDSAVRALANQGLTIVSIKDITPIPHNGPRAKKVRRV